MRRQSSRKLDRLSARCRLWAARNLQARRLHTQQRDISNSAVTSFFFFSKKNGQTSTTNKRRGHFGGYEILTVYIQRETNKTKILTGTSNAGHSMGLPRMQIFSSGAHSSYRGWVRRSVPPSRGIWRGLGDSPLHIPASASLRALWCSCAATWGSSCLLVGRAGSWAPRRERLCLAEDKQTSPSTCSATCSAFIRHTSLQRCIACSGVWRASTDIWWSPTCAATLLTFRHEVRTCWWRWTRRWWEFNRLEHLFVFGTTSIVRCRWHPRRHSLSMLQGRLAWTGARGANVPWGCSACILYHSWGGHICANGTGKRSSCTSVSWLTLASSS